MDIIGLLQQGRQAQTRTDARKGEEADDGFEKLFKDYFDVDDARARSERGAADAATAAAAAREAGRKVGVDLGKGNADGTPLTGLQEVAAAADTDTAATGGLSVSRERPTQPALADPDAPAAAVETLVARGVRETQHAGAAGRLAPDGAETPTPADRRQGDAARKQNQNTNTEVARGLGAKVEQTAPGLVSRPGAAPGTAQASIAGQAPPAAAATGLPGAGDGFGGSQPLTSVSPPGVTANPAATATANQLAAVNGGTTAAQAAAQAAAQSQAAAPVAQPTPTQPAPAAQPSTPAPVPVDAGGTVNAGQSQTGVQTRSAAQTHTPQAARHAPASQPVAEQVAIQIQRAVKAGIDRINIQLKPANLGRIDIAMEVGMDGRVQAVVQADNPDTLHMLMRDHRELERALLQANLQLDQNGLSFELKGEGKRYAADGSAITTGDGEGDGEEERAADGDGFIERNDGDGVDLRV